MLFAGFFLCWRWAGKMREAIQIALMPFWLTWKVLEAAWDATMWGRKKLKAWQREKPYGDRKLADRKALSNLHVASHGVWNWP